MRDLRVTRLSTLALAALAACLAFPPAPATAAETGRVLPVTGRVNALVADDHSHLWVATDAGILVTDTTGRRLRTVSYNQVLDLGLSRDGTRLWAAERGNVALSVFDTASMRLVARHPLPPGVCPVSVAPTATRVAFGFTCDGQFGGVGFLSLADPRARPVTRTTSSSWSYNPLVRALPTGDTVIAASQGLSPASVGVLTPARVLREGRLESCSNLRDLAVAPNGASFVPACGAPYRFDRYDVRALAISGSSLASPYPNAVAFSRSGKLLAGGVDGLYGADVYTYPAAASPRRPVDLPGAGVPKGIAFSPSGSVLYAIAVNAGKHVLHRLPGERATG